MIDYHFTANMWQFEFDDLFIKAKNKEEAYDKIKQRLYDLVLEQAKNILVNSEANKYFLVSVEDEDKTNFKIKR